MAFVDKFEIIPNRLYFCTLSDMQTQPKNGDNAIYFNLDDQLRYEEYCYDFGPLSLGKTYYFCQYLSAMLEDPKTAKKKIYYISSDEDTFRNNAAVLICAFSILYLGRNATKAYKPLLNPSRKFIYFHDASYFPNTFDLTVKDCVQGLYKAYTLKFFKGFSTKKQKFLQKFNVDEYENYCNLESGDLNWLVQKQFVAFAGPFETKKHLGNGYYSMTPADYIPYMKSKNVKLIIRLNQKMYKASHFKKAGIDHLDLFYPDGGNPPEEIIDKFIQVCENTILAGKGAIGVHCKAGLGRTGTCIGLYLMKHYPISARELIGYFRIARPGTIIGPQQQFLVENEAWMKESGRDYYAKQKMKQGGNKLGPVSKNRVVAKPEFSENDEAFDIKSPVTQGDVLNQKKLKVKTKGVHVKI